MKYEITIDKPVEGNGHIDLRRLVQLADIIAKVAEGALQLRLRGVSITAGRKQAKLDDALRIDLVGVKKGSTRLQVECSKLGETLKGIQFDAFRHEGQLQLAEQTPMTLFMTTFNDALDNDASKEFLDKPLLNQLVAFKKVFRAPEESFHISNEGNTKELLVKKESLKRIAVLEESLPEPERIVIQGTVDLLQHSSSRIRVKGPDGVMDGFLSDDLDRTEVAQYWTKEATVIGLVHFKPGGRKSIEVQRIFPVEQGENYFAKQRKGESTEQQIERQLREKGGRNTAKSAVGQWPGDEDFDLLIGQLTA
ncbi:MAG: hypothetical protein JNJ64_16005 [Flavobacteriales bacterium]|nr:hypothetical protein [Flavobacteriales bacterium]